MGFLAPAFLAGLAAIAVPVLIHLINRERRVVVEFPSLMFLQRIPYKSVRRQKIRHLLLLILRCVAIALLVAAFARPFFQKRAAAIGTTGARELVVLLDRSASMGYGGRWSRAKDAARKAIAGLGPHDHATVVLFAGDASVTTQPMATPAQLNAAVNAAKLSAEGTRYAPALKLASQIIAASTLPRREVVLISDYQKSGWAAHGEVSFPRGTVVTPVDLGGGSPADVGVSQVTTDRDSAGDRDHVTVAARLVNTGAKPASVEATLVVGGRDVQTQRTTVPASSAQQVAFVSIAVPSVATKGSVRITADSLAANDEFNFTIAPDEAVPVLLVEPSSPRDNQDLFLSRALAIGDKPSFDVTEKRANALTARDLENKALIVLDEVPPPSGAIGQRLRALVESGSGLVVAPGAAGTDGWPAQWRALLPATVGQVVDRTADAGGTLSALDYASPIFEIFNAPRSGDFSMARFYRYRALAPQSGGSIPARFDDGNPALVERALGSGRIVVWASTFDSYWTNLPLQPVFLPFVHQLGKHVGRYADPRASFAAGEVLDFSRHGELTAPLLASGAAGSATELVLAAPSGAQERVTAAGANHLVTLREQGFYELRGPATPVGAGRPIAVNIDPTESDLSHLDPRDIVAAVTAVDAERAPNEVIAGTPREQESRQKLWWYLLLVALFLMAVETALSNRLSRAAT